MLGLFSSTTPTAAAATTTVTVTATVVTKPLYQIWTELNTPTKPVPSLNETKQFVYNKVSRLMNCRKRECILPMSDLHTYGDEIITWLEETHKLEANEGDYENDDGTITKFLVVRW